MKCQGCGVNPAIVHMEEMREGRRIHLWLCEECARNRQSDGEASPGDGEGVSGASGFGSFLGRFIDAEESRAGATTVCSSCGFVLEELSRTNRLGCPACYANFREDLAPLLARLNRHSSHVGKVPRRAGGLGPGGEIARWRVELEKAIAGENYEEAARLRDLIARAGVAEPDEPTDERE